MLCLDVTAARVALTRLRSIAWATNPDHHRQGAQLALLREYLYRAAQVALELGGTGWPWFDAAARLTLPIHGMSLVPDVTAGALPGYVFLDSESHYRGPGTDPLEDEVIAMGKGLNGRYLTSSMKSTCVFYVRWEALKNHPAVRGLALPDLYEPLIQFYERGGWFRMEHGDYIDLGGPMLGRGSPATYAQRPSLPSLDPAVLDQIDQDYTRRSLDELLAGILARVVPGLQVYEAVLQSPASEAALAALQARAQVALGVPVPAGYLTFLRLVDGLNWDGLFIYSSGPGPLVTEPTVFVRDFVATNLAWRQADPAAAARLYLAEDPELLYAYDPAGGAEPYLAYERASGTVNERFKSAEELLGRALIKHVWANEKVRRGLR